MTRAAGGPLPCRKPEWLKKPIPDAASLQRMERLLRFRHLHTVCESAICPNLGECFAKGTATFLILGDVCTRDCRFCGVTTGIPGALDADEPRQLAAAVAALGLQHVVITSVTRDDLHDGGAGHYAATIQAVRAACPGVTVEVLVPDFRGRGPRYRHGACGGARSLQPQCRDGAATVSLGPSASGLRPVARSPCPSSEARRVVS